MEIGDGGILARSRPIEFTGIYDHTAEGGTVIAEELGCGADYDIRTVLDRTDKIRSTEGIIYHRRQTVLVSKLSYRINIGNIAVGVAESLNVDRSRVILNCRLDLCENVNIYERSGNAEIGKRMYYITNYLPCQ